MDVMLAAYHLVHDYPGGAVALAPLVGKSATTLSHEVSPQYPTAKLGLETAVNLSVWSGDRRIASAFAAQVGGMLVMLPTAGGTGTSMQDIAAMAREFSDLVSRVTEAVSDGRVSANELREVQHEAGQLLAAVQATVQHVAALEERSRADVTPLRARAA